LIKYILHPYKVLLKSNKLTSFQCHYSPPLDLAGTGPVGDQVGKPYFSNVMHEYHGQLDDNGVPVFPPNTPVEDTCYQCHPGKITQCQRGAMKTGGMDCNDCHGDIPLLEVYFLLTRR
jgi:hypothetical protein